MSKDHDCFREDLDEQDMASTDAAIKYDLSRLLKDGDIVLDVGANRGQFALKVLESNPNVKIYCFEPIPEVFNELVEVVRKDFRISPHRYAISSRTGKDIFCVTEWDEGSGFLEPLPNQSSGWAILNKKIPVDTIRLDDFIIEEEITEGPIGLLKTDAHGKDLEVLLSAGSFLTPERIKTLLVEVVFKTFWEGQNSYHEIFAELDKRGYRVANIYSHRAYDEWFWWADVLFIPKTLEI